MLRFGVGVGDAVRTVFDATDHDGIGFVTPVPFGRIGAVQAGAVR